MRHQWTMRLVFGCAALLSAIGMAPARSAPPTLRCDDTLKDNFRPDGNTQVVLVKRFEKGDVVALAKDVPARSPKASQSICLVKLNVGPGHPGPAAAPSTSQGIGIEVWLPDPERWNGRIHAMGGGGWQGGSAGQRDRIGAIYAFLTANMEGAVSSTTDTGHAGGPALGSGNPRGDFAMNPDGTLNDVLLRDFSERAIHEQAVKTKALTLAYYGRAAAHSYWEGGSTGGRQGHKLAQAYPTDFDGIIANYPAIHWSRFVPAMIYAQLVIERDLAGTPLSDAQLDLVSNAAIGACDEVGGVHLGFILDPAICRYDPTRDGAILCAAHGGRNTTPDCLAPAQARAVNKIWYGPTRDGSVPDPAKDNGWGPLGPNHLWYGPARGTSLWNAYFTRAFGFPAGLANGGAGSTISSDMIALVLGDPALAHQGFENARGTGRSGFRKLGYAALAKAIDRAAELDRTRFHRLDTDDPDLSAFAARGGKMLAWQGFNDEVIPPQGIKSYYDDVVEKLGGVDKVQSFYRLIFVPGNGHMSPNGTSNPSANPPVIAPGGFYDALVRWVEQGIPPDSIVMRSPGDKPASRSLPACAYPSRPTYGTGDPNDASSFSCR